MLVNGDSKSFYWFKLAVSGLVGLAAAYAIVCSWGPDISFAERALSLAYPIVPAVISNLFLDVFSLAFYGRLDLVMEQKDKGLEAKPSLWRGILHLFGMNRPYLNTFKETVHYLVAPYYRERKVLVDRINELSDQLSAKRHKDAQFYDSLDEPAPKSPKRKALERNLVDAKKALEAFEDKASGTILSQTRKNLHLIYNPKRDEMTKKQVKEILEKECARIEYEINRPPIH
jgi:hypothetical protein